MLLHYFLSESSRLPALPLSPSLDFFANVVPPTSHSCIRSVVPHSLFFPNYSSYSYLSWLYLAYLWLSWYSHAALSHSLFLNSLRSLVSYGSHFPFLPIVPFFPNPSFLSSSSPPLCLCTVPWFSPSTSPHNPLYFLLFSISSLFKHLFLSTLYSILILLLGCKRLITFPQFILSTLTPELYVVTCSFSFSLFGFPSVFFFF